MRNGSVIKCTECCIESNARRQQRQSNNHFAICRKQVSSLRKFPTIRQKNNAIQKSDSSLNSVFLISFGGIIDIRVDVGHLPCVILLGFVLKCVLVYINIIVNFLKILDDHSIYSLFDNFGLQNERGNVSQ